MANQTNRPTQDQNQKGSDRSRQEQGVNRSGDMSRQQGGHMDESRRGRPESSDISDAE